MSRKKITRLSIVLFLGLATCVMLTECSSGSKKKPGANEKTLDPNAVVQKPAPIKLPGAETITGLGRNRDGVFSADGQRIAYVSAGRSPNGTSQIFEMNMKTHRERQITFQDGLAASPRYVSGNNDLLYCNNSDEMKEKIDLHHIMQNLGGGKAGAPAQAPNRMEIYLRESTGSRILRLTTNPGFDCDIAVHPKHKKFVYVTEQMGKLRLAQLDLAQTRHEYLKSPDKAVLHSPTFAPDGKNLVWSEGDSDANLQLVFGLSDGHVLKMLTSVPAVHWHAAFSPNGKWIVFSSNRGDAKGKPQPATPQPAAPQPAAPNSTAVAIDSATTLAQPPSPIAPHVTTPPSPEPNVSVGKSFSLYAFNTEKSCILRLTRFDSGDDFHPYFSPDGSRILFTHATQEQSQLFTVPFLDASTCDPNTPP